MELQRPLEKNGNRVLAIWVLTVSSILIATAFLQPKKEHLPWLFIGMIAASLPLLILGKRANDNGQQSEGILRKILGWIFGVLILRLLIILCILGFLIILGSDMDTLSKRTSAVIDSLFPASKIQAKEITTEKSEEKVATVTKKVQEEVGPLYSIGEDWKRFEVGPRGIKWERKNPFVHLDIRFETRNGLTYLDSEKPHSKINWSKRYAGLDITSVSFRSHSGSPLEVKIEH